MSEESIDLVAGEYLLKLAGSRVPQFVPLFVGRFTRKRLHELTGLRPRTGLIWPARSLRIVMREAMS